MAVLADAAILDDGLAAAAAGADLVASTLSGHTADSPRQAGPDLVGPDLVGQLAARQALPVAAEGRYTTPEQAAAALDRGAHTVVVGGAITRPTEITRRFAAALAPRTTPHRPAQAHE